jgi:hypothetical protein
MQRFVFMALIVCYCLTSSPFKIGTAFATDNAIEISITLSGTILIGVGYRWLINSDSSVRLGSYLGYAGKPYGFHAGFMQNFSHSKNWLPYLGLGGDLMLARDKDHYKMLYFVRNVAGIAYKPNDHSAYNSELWVAFFPKKQRIAPIGLSFGIMTSLK